MNTKPIVKLTSGQWKSLLERVVAREQGIPQRLAQRGEGELLNAPKGMIPVGGGPPEVDFLFGKAPPRYLAGEASSYRGLSPELGFQSPGPLESLAGIAHKDPAQAMVDNIRAQALKVGPGELGVQTELPLLIPRDLSLQGQWREGLRAGSPRAWPAPSVVQSPRGAALQATLGGEGQRARMPSAIDQIMAQSPESERLMGRLRLLSEEARDTPGGAFRDFPLDEARALYKERPDLYAPGGVPKPVKRLSVAPLTPEEIGPGALKDITSPRINYETLKYRGVETPFEQKARSEASKTIGAPADIKEVLSTAELLERMWKFMGGKRSVSGHMWEMLKKGSSGKARLIDTREYFIRSGLRWREDPSKFAKQWPREAKLLNEIWGELEKEVGGL